MRLATNFIRRTKEIGFFTVPYFNDYCPLKAGLEMARRDTFMQIFMPCNYLDSFCDCFIFYRST